MVYIEGLHLQGLGWLYHPNVYLKMGHLCDLCGEQRSMVYCRSDAAYLCLSHDWNVRFASVFFRHHLRTLVCERCNSPLAIARCVNEKISLCQNCEWTGHNMPPLLQLHLHNIRRRQLTVILVALQYKSFWDMVICSKSPFSG